MKTLVQTRPKRNWVYNPDLSIVAAVVLLRTGEYISPYEAMDYTLDWIEEVNAHIDGAQFYIDKNATSDGD